MRRLARLALLAAALAAASARADKLVGVTVTPWRYFAGPAPAGWAEPGFDDRAWGGPAAPPFGPRRPSLPFAPPSSTAPVGTVFDWTPGTPLLLRARLTAADPARVRVLDLRVAYADGFVAYLDGREIARRGMDPAGRAAVGPHGPEWESVAIPVPSPAVPSLRREGNVLAVAVFAWPARNPLAGSAPAVAVGAGAASGVRIVRGPYLSAPSDHPDGAALRFNWRTDLPATGTLIIEQAGPGASEPPRRFATSGRATQQVVPVGGLARGAAYRYRLEVDAGGGDVATAGPSRFETLPAPPKPLRFAVYGDMRYPGHEAHRAVVAGLVREAPAVVFNTGDLTDVGSEESNWQKYFEITAPMGAIAPVVPALGNHDADRRGAGAVLTWSLFGVPAAPPPGWTSLDLGGVHFVILSSNDMRNSAQRMWLRDDLARARRHHARAIFAFCHEGPWAHGIHGGSTEMAHGIAPLLAAAHVDMLFSGHDHIYERGVGVTPEGKLPYIVTGGGGAPLYPPSCHAASGPPPVVPGPLPACPSSVAALTNTYHYLIVEVAPGGIRICPRHPDGSPVEACVKLPVQNGRGGRR